MFSETIGKSFRGSVSVSVGRKRTYSLDILGQCFLSLVLSISFFSGFSLEGS